tara:strand:+ start:5822 stop:6055 length:234 start_codon:yes stop_codon:yes gene_type:complete
MVENRNKPADVLPLSGLVCAAASRPLIKIKGRKKYHELSGWQAACYLGVFYAPDANIITVGDVCRVSFFRNFKFRFS